MSFLIFSDVSLDIDKEAAKRYDVRFVPMEYVLGEEVRYCTTLESDEMMHHFYEELRNKTITRTSQITPQRYAEVFEEYAKAGEKILYFALSSGLSNTYESACLAARDLMDEYSDAKIEIFDTLAATGGMGIMVEMACRMREEGKSLEETVEWLRKYIFQVHLRFKVEDLMYLKRGGRISAATAVVGTALNIKPILVINHEGKLETVAKKRGTKQAIKHLAEVYEECHDMSLSDLVYICCGDCMEEAKELARMVQEIEPKAKVRTTMLGPIIGAHTGPDMLSIIFYGSER